MASLASASPPPPRGLHRSLVVAVEQIGTACKGSEFLGFDTIDEDEHRSAVRVLVEVRQPDRLRCGIAVANRTVRQEGGLLIRPQHGAQMLDALGQSRLDHDSMALCPCPFEQLGQGVLERCRQEMVKADLSQARS